MNSNKILKTFFLSFVIQLVLISGIIAQDNTAAMAAADSSRFSVNRLGGWQLFNSFVSAISQDSVQLEFIVQHDKNINWSQEQLVGKIKSSTLVPQYTQEIPFSVLSTSFTIRITDQGKCYMKISDGNAPEGDTVILAVKIFYKK